MEGQLPNVAATPPQQDSWQDEAATKPHVKRDQVKSRTRPRMLTSILAAAVAARLKVKPLKPSRRRSGGSSAEVQQHHAGRQKILAAAQAVVDAVNTETMQRLGETIKILAAAYSEVSDELRSSTVRGSSSRKAVAIALDAQSPRTPVLRSPVPRSPTSRRLESSWGAMAGRRSFAFGSSSSLIVNSSRDEGLPNAPDGRVYDPETSPATAFLIDLDGTIYEPLGLIDGAADFYKWLGVFALDISLVLLSLPASHSPPLTLRARVPAEDSRERHAPCLRLQQYVSWRPNSEPMHSSGSAEVLSSISRWSSRRQELSWRAKEAQHAAVCRLRLARASGTHTDGGRVPVRLYAHCHP